MRGILTSILLALPFFAVAKHKRKTVAGMKNEITVLIPGFNRLGNEGRGPVVGLDYTRYLDGKGIWSAGAGFYTGVHYAPGILYKSGERGNYRAGSFFYFTPGISCHPLGNTHIVNYSAGVCGIIGSVYTHNHQEDPSGDTRVLEEQANLLGIAVTNDLVLHNPRHPHGMFGLHCSLGYNFSSVRNGAFVQFGFKFGGKFQMSDKT